MTPRTAAPSTTTTGSDGSDVDATLLAAPALSPRTRAVLSARLRCMSEDMARLQAEMVAVKTLIAQSAPARPTVDWEPTGSREPQPWQVRTA